MARERVGALLVLPRRDSTAELTEGGIAIGSEISQELILAIFQKVSPLHDGALTVEDGRLARAGVVLPLTQRRDVPGCYGTRHRAGMGLAERCDALVIVVSEERGEVTLMEGRDVRTVERPAELAAVLLKLQEGPREKPGARIRRLLVSHLRLKMAALGLAGLVWSMSFLASGTTIRMVNVPIEFSNVPGGMEVADESTDSVELQIRGSPWIMDSVSMNKLIARFDLRQLRPGNHSLELAPRMLDLPPGIVVDRVTPAHVRLVLTEMKPAAPAR
jgi:hypothetical protein